MTISVLISTYCKEKPEYLDRALQSIWTDQERKPDEIVLVEDGALTEALDAVISVWRERTAGRMTVVKKSKNGGLAAALNDGIAVAKGELIARMDSDDISMPNRFAVQEKYMVAHPDVDILGGSLEEFNDEGTRRSVRHYPRTFDDVKRTMHRMSPLGHPSVMFRKRFFDDGFRYSSKYHICEDVTLWYDAVAAGRVINNVDDVILRFRRNDSMMKRRSKEKAWSEFLAYNDGIYRVWGLFTLRYAYSFYRLIFRLLPLSWINSIYRKEGMRNFLSSGKRKV